METYTNKVGAYRTDNNLGNNDRRKIGGCFNLWRHRTTTTDTKSISKDRTPTNQTKSNENKTDRHRETDIET